MEMINKTKTELKLNKLFKQNVKEGNSKLIGQTRIGFM